MYIYMYVGKHMHVYVNLSKCVCKETCIIMCSGVHEYMYVCACMHVGRHVWVYACTYAYM